MTAAATAAPAAGAPAAGAPTKPLFDPSVIALLSLAIGSLAAGAATVLAFLGKVPLAMLPLVLAGVGLVVSSPSLLLAFIKLRKRNLGPILDANGWAINAKAKINVPFGERLTTIAKLPAGASLDSNDRYAEKRVLWPKFVGAALFLIWVYLLLDYSGFLYRLTKNWETPLGTPPANIGSITTRRRRTSRRIQPTPRPKPAPTLLERGGLPPLFLHQRSAAK